MKNIRLENYHILFTVFLVITISFIILLIILFFVLDIKKIISVKTGFAVRKSIKELNVMNRYEDNKKYKGYNSQWKNGEKQKSPVQGSGRGDETEQINIPVIDATVKLEEKNIAVFDEPEQRDITENEEKHKKEISETEFFDITETKEIKSVETAVVKRRTI